MPAVCIEEFVTRGRLPVSRLGEAKRLQLAMPMMFDAVLERALERLGIPVTDATVRSGDPVEQIIRAGKKYQVIVVSDSGKSRLKRFVVGSVAFGVMGHAPNSVLNVR